jgi:hypothetical protein
MEYTKCYFWFAHFKSEKILIRDFDFGEDLEIEIL